MLQLKYSQRCGYFVLELESKIAPSLYEISYDNLQFRLAKQRSDTITSADLSYD